MVLELHSFNEPENDQFIIEKLKDPHSNFGLDKKLWMMLVNEV
jgi:hypothetical protein